MMKQIENLAILVANHELVSDKELTEYFTKNKGAGLLFHDYLERSELHNSIIALLGRVKLVDDISLIRKLFIHYCTSPPNTVEQNNLFNAMVKQSPDRRMPAFLFIKYLVGYFANEEQKKNIIKQMIDFLSATPVCVIADCLHDMIRHVVDKDKIEIFDKFFGLGIHDRAEVLKAMFLK